MSSHSDTDSAPKALPKSKIKRFLPVMIIVAAFTAFIALGGPKYISLDALRDNQDALKAFVENNFIKAVLGFILLYAVLVAISVPGASFMSIFGGFLFGTLTGTLSVVVGATLGATALFLAARSAFGEGLAAKFGNSMQKFEKGLQENEISYLFILRLVPLFPFVMVNIVPALFKVKLRNYILTTFFGIIPGSLVYVSVGNGVGDALKAGGDIPLAGLMTRPAVILPIVGLILLSMIPVVYKKLSKKKQNG